MHGAVSVEDTRSLEVSSRWLEGGPLYGVDLYGRHFLWEGASLREVHLCWRSGRVVYQWVVPNQRHAFKRGPQLPVNRVVPGGKKSFVGLKK